MRPSGPMPWKPAMTACRPSPNLRIRPSVSIAVDAGGAVARVGAQRHLPALPAAGRDAHLLQGQRHQAGGDVLARGDHGVVLAGVVEERGLADPADELVGLAGHGGDDDGDVVAALDLALHLGGRVADAVEVGDAGAAEFHHQTGHGPRACDMRGTRPLIGWVGGVQAGESGGWRAPARGAGVSTLRRRTTSCRCARYVLDPAAHDIVARGVRQLPTGAQQSMPAFSPADPRCACAALEFRGSPASRTVAPYVAPHPRFRESGRHARAGPRGARDRLSARHFRWVRFGHRQLRDPHGGHELT